LQSLYTGAHCARSSQMSDTDEPVKSHKQDLRVEEQILHCRIVARYLFLYVRYD
jgi:hypothetical protein